MGVHVFVRRGGPNYQEGLQNMKQLGYRLNLPIEVYGPETHLTKICTLALFPERRARGDASKQLSKLRSESASPGLSPRDGNVPVKKPASERSNAAASVSADEAAAIAAAAKPEPVSLMSVSRFVITHGMSV